MEYGYLENGYLRSKVLEPIHKRVRQDDGTYLDVTISVEAQAESLSAQGWMPVDLIDESQLECEDGYAIRIVPVVRDGRISYDYEKVSDPAFYERQIDSLKNSLSESDYKIIKCYEAYLIGETMPYNAFSLHSERQAIRDQINQIEELKNSLTQ